MKDGAEDVVLSSRLEVVELGSDDDGEMTTSCAIVPAETAPTAPAGAQNSGQSQRSQREALRRRACRS